MARLPDLPLFPLPLVLLPGEVLPLHIFEPRYRELVARCLAGPEPFCVVHADDDGMREVGCLASGLEVVERFDDGRLSIVVSGGEPVRIERIDEDAHPYLSADGVTIEDDGEPLAEDEIEAGAGRLPRAAERDRGRGPRAALGPAAPLLRDRRAHRRRAGGRAGAARVALGAARASCSSPSARAGRNSLRIAAERERRAVRNGKVEPTRSRRRRISPERRL